MSSKEAQTLGKAGLTALIMGTIGTAIHTSHKIHPIDIRDKAPLAKEPAYIPNYDNNPLLAFSQSGRGLKPKTPFKKGDAVQERQADAAIDEITKSIAYLKSLGSKINKKYLAYLTGLIIASVLNHYYGLDKLAFKHLDESVLTVLNHLDSTRGGMIGEDYEMNPFYHPTRGPLPPIPPAPPIPPVQAYRIPSPIQGFQEFIPIPPASLNQLLKDILYSLLVGEVVSGFGRTRYIYSTLSNMLKKEEKEEKDTKKGKGLYLSGVKHITDKVSSAKTQLDKMYKKITSEDGKKMTKKALAGIAASIILASGAYIASKHMNHKNNSETLLHTEYNDPHHRYNVRLPSSFEQLI